MTTLLFINAPYPAQLAFYGQPTSLLYAIAPTLNWLRSFQKTHYAAVVNYNLVSPPPSIMEVQSHVQGKVASLRPQIVAISTTTASLKAAYAIAEAVKSASPESFVVIGGPHDDDSCIPSAFHCEACDVSVAGDGESALLSIVQDLIQVPCCKSIDRMDRCDSRISGMETYGLFRWYWKGHAGMTCVSCPGSFQKIHLSDLPQMPRYLLNDSERFHYGMFRHENGERKPTAQVMTQRGCVAKCDYCSESQALRKRSFTSLRRELEYLVTEGYQAVFFDDSTFTSLPSDRNRLGLVKQLGVLMKSLGLEWGCQTRADMVTEEWAQALRDGGCTYVYMGVESFDDAILKALGKNGSPAGQYYDAGCIRKALECLGALRIRVGVSLLLGAYDSNFRTIESIESATKTFQEVASYVSAGIISTVSINLLGFYPGTRSTMEAIARGVITDDDWYVVPESRYPLDLLEENPAKCPLGGREIAATVLSVADELFGQVIASKHRPTHLLRSVWELD
jgi:radical SAM superfamily enzyme YgiQ (UPF0313 family)